MQLFFRLIALTILLLSLHLPWENKALASNNGEKCETLINTEKRLPSSIPATFIGEDGRLYISKEAYVYAGQPVYTKKFKAPTLASFHNSAGEANASITVDNFLHNGKYHRALIPLDPAAIDGVYTQTMPFPIIPGVMSGHVQARFVMKPGFEIQLLDKDTGLVKELVKDMIISYEAALPPDTSYNFALGAVNANPLVGRLVSGPQKYSEGPDREFRQYLLPLSALEKTQLLAYFVNDAINIKMDLYYNTVTRNCTTTIFDGIDSLPRFQKAIHDGHLSPFLTTIGGDPVIGPALNALLDRFGKEVRHVQDMKDEYAGKFVDLGNPDRALNERLPFAPGGKNPMALVIATHGTEHLSAEEKIMINTMVEDIVDHLPETINMLLASAFSLAEDLEKSPQILQAITTVISEKLNDRLNQLGGSLPTRGVGIQVLFTPYPTDSRTTDLRSKGVRAQLPFDLERIDVLPNNRSQVIEQVQAGIEQVDAIAPEDLPAYLKTFSVMIRLKENESKVTTQILLGMQPTEKTIDIQNDQVVLDTFRIPEPKENHPTRWQRWKNALNPWAPKRELHAHVNLLMSHAQELQAGSNPKALIRFGSQPEVLNSGLLNMPRVADNRYLCWSGAHPHTPQLLGRLAESPLGKQGWLNGFLNRVLSGRQVMLSITDLEMNLEALNIQTTRIRIGVIGLRCIDLDSVNAQFGEQANEKLQEIISNLNTSDLKLP